MSIIPQSLSRHCASFLPTAGLAALTLLSVPALTGSAAWAQQGPPPVTVANPVVQEILEWDEYTGRFEAVDEVEVRPRIGGFIQSIHFEDGQLIEQGELLFIIDQRPFEIALDQAKSDLEQAEARAEFTDQEVDRYRTLVSRNAASQQTLDERIQDDRIARAEYLRSQASVAEAELNLEYTLITAPISGRISRALVTEGNLISGGTNGSTHLTTIVSLDPIHFYFTADEAAYLKYYRLNQAGDRASSRESGNPVYIRLFDEDTYTHEGKMDFVDNRIDRSTGTITGRALLQNPNVNFIPGMFGRLRLVGSSAYEAMILPDAAIGADQSRRFVYVVDENNVAQIKPVQLGRLIKGFRVITSGLEPTDQVIINGLLRVRPGAPVTPQPGEIDVPEDLGKGRG